MASCLARSCLLDLESYGLLWHTFPMKKGSLRLPLLLDFSDTSGPFFVSWINNSKFMSTFLYLISFSGVLNLSGGVV